jgi:Tfp pilus assembly protein PilF
MWYGKQGDTDRALIYCKEALEMMRELFGERHPHVARSFSNVGFCYSQQGNVRHALRYMQQSLAISRELFGECHPSTISVATRVVTHLIRSERRQEAYSLVTHFLPLAPIGQARESLKMLENQLLAKTIRPGFRQPPKATKGKKRKKRR